MKAALRSDPTKGRTNGRSIPGGRPRTPRHLPAETGSQASCDRLANRKARRPMDSQQCRVRALAVAAESSRASPASNPRLSFPPRHVGNSRRRIDRPGQHKQQIAQPVQINHQIRRNRLAARTDWSPASPVVRSARRQIVRARCKQGRAAAAAGQNEFLERRQAGFVPSMACFQRLEVRRPEHRQSMRRRIGRRQFGSKIE